MNGLCFIPAILKIFFTVRRGMSRLAKLAVYVLDLLSIVCQATIFFVFKAYSNVDRKPSASASDSVEFSSASTSSDVVSNEKDDFFIAYSIISAFLISLSYWQNFTEVRFSTNRITMFLQAQINELRKHNAKIYMIISPIKVLLIFFFAYALVPEQVQNKFGEFSNNLNTTKTRGYEPMVSLRTSSADSSFNDAQTMSGPFKLNGKSVNDLFYANNDFIIPFLIYVISSLICYYTARVSCKVLMQGIGFALPLALATPVTFVVLFVSSIRANFEHITMFKGTLGEYFYWDSFRVSDAMYTILIGFILYYASQLWIASHIWSPKLERMAKNERF